MKIKLSTIISQQFNASFEALNNLKTIPGPVMFKIRGIRKQLVAENEKYNELRSEYIEEFAEKDKDGKPVYIDANSIKIADVKGFNEKMKDLLSTEIDVAEISFSDLSEHAQQSLTSNDLYNLEFITE